MRRRWYGAVVMIGLATGEAYAADLGRFSEPLAYLAREEGYQPPIPGELTLYQTNGPMIAGSVQALAEGLDGRIYAGTFGQGIYAKEPKSGRWRPAEEGPKDRFLMTLTVLPDGSLLAGAVRGGIFRSHDGGRRWTPSSEGLGNSQVPAIVRDAKTGLVYAGTGSGVYKSADQGRRWTASNRGLEMVLSRSLAVGADGTLYTGTGGNGLFVSRDGGGVWRRINDGLADEDGLRENFIRVLATDELGAVYAGSFGGGIFKSTDGGRRWTAVNAGLTNLSIRGLIAARGVLYAGTGEGIFRSATHGLRWDSISDGMPDTNVQALLLGKDGTLYAGTGSGVLERPPGGPWRSVDRGMAFPVVRTILVDPVKGLFAGTETHGLFRSKDTGETWVHFNEGLASPAIRGLARDEAGVQYAATADTIYRADWKMSRWVPDAQGLDGAPRQLIAAGGRLVAATSRGLFERPTASTAWSPAALAGAPSIAVSALTGDPSGVVYAATGRQVYRRRPADPRWEPIGRPLPSGSSMGLSAGRALYAWTDRSVFRAGGRDGELRWDEIGKGLPEGSAVVSLAVIGGERDLLVAATSGGVWWTADSGAQWHPTHGRFPAIPFQVIHAADPGLILAGSEEHGVFAGIDLVPRRKPIERP